MKRINQFIKESKVLSRVLFVFFLIFCFIPENNKAEVISYGLVFLIPAIINELSKNPIFEESKSSFIIFMRNTQIVSRILFNLCIFFTAALGVGSVSQTVFQTFPMMAISFLIPAMIIELKINFLGNKYTTDIDLEKGKDLQQEEKSYLFQEGNNKRYLINYQKLLMIVLVFVLAIFVVGIIEKAYSSGIIIAVIINTCFVLCIVFSNTDEVKRNRKEIFPKKNLPKWQSIFGVILCIVSCFFLLLFLLTLNDSNFDIRVGIKNIMLFTMLLFLVMFLLLMGIYYLQGKFICSVSLKEKLNIHKREISPNKKLTVATHDISYIDEMDGHTFEYFCADILKKNGFLDVSVTKGSGDQGVDILATKEGIRYAIQCKNYSSALSNKAIQEVNAGKIFYNCHVGVVMTNSIFTASAEALAEATGVLLWNREILKKMIKDIN